MPGLQPPLCTSSAPTLPQPCPPHLPLTVALGLTLALLPPAHPAPLCPQEPWLQRGTCILQSTPCTISPAGARPCPRLEGNAAPQHKVGTHGTGNIFSEIPELAAGGQQQKAGQEEASAVHGHPLWCLGPCKGSSGELRWRLVLRNANLHTQVSPGAQQDVMQGPVCSGIKCQLRLG